MIPAAGSDPASDRPTRAAALVSPGGVGYIAADRPGCLPLRPRRGGRVVDRAALEMRNTGNRIGGSNPSLSAMLSAKILNLKYDSEGLYANPQLGLQLEKVIPLGIATALAAPLRTLPYAGRFDGFHAVPASVSKTCLVRFDNNKYSVAASAVGRPVE